MLENQGPEPNSSYQGEFTTEMRHQLLGEAHGLEDNPSEDYFSLLSSVASAQGYPDMAAAIDNVSQTSMGTVLRGEFDPIPTTWLEGKVTRTKPAEHWAREMVARSLTNVFVDLTRIKEGIDIRGTEKNGTTTLADLTVGGDLDKEVFVTLARILARKPESLDATPPEYEEVVPPSRMGLTPGQAAQGAVMPPDQPGMIARFQRVVVESTVPGYNFVMWRHNSSGYIHGDGTDKHKLFLEEQ